MVIQIGRRLAVGGNSSSHPEEKRQLVKHFSQGSGLIIDLMNSREYQETLFPLLLSLKRILELSMG